MIVNGLEMKNLQQKCVNLFCIFISIIWRENNCCCL